MNRRSNRRAGKPAGSKRDSPESEGMPQRSNGAGERGKQDRRRASGGDDVGSWDLPQTSESATGLGHQRTVLAPDPRAGIPCVYLKGHSFHPLQYRKRIERVEGARPGDLAAVYADGNRLVGYGIYNPRSEISLRMLWHQQDLPTEESWSQKLQAAVSLRKDTLQLDKQSTAWRVVHSESDGLSGIVIDRFGDVLSAEAFGLGMYQRSRALLQRLAPMCDAQHWIVRTSPQFLSQEGCDPPELKSESCPSSIVIQENGARFRIRFEGGHKTGFFCDQRENRRRLAEFCNGKSVLDLCCYTGGFSVQAAVAGKAEEVTGVDLDEEPLRLAKENANLNQARIRFVQADAFSYMREMIRNQRQYDVVVLDPPKLIRTRVEIEEGTRRHFALNRLAMRLVRPGGLLLSCSCAGLLSEAEFMDLLIAASRQSGEELQAETADRPARYAARSMQIIAKTGAAPDHPVISTCPETEYLKAVWMIMN